MASAYAMASSEESGAEQSEPEAPSRLPPARVAVGASLLVATLLAVASAATWAERAPAARGSRAGATNLRRAEETTGVGADLPLCGSIPQWRRYANADTVKDVECKCGKGEVKSLCAKGSRSQNACCRPRRSKKARKEAKLAKSKEACTAPEGQPCTVMVSFETDADRDFLSGFAQQHGTGANVSVLSAVKIVTMHFGEDRQGCCTAYAASKSAEKVSGVDFDQEATTMMGGGLGVSGPSGLGVSLPTDPTILPPGPPPPSSSI